MSESAKKKLVQKRLPFAIIASDKTSAASPQSQSPVTPVPSRKRKPSTDGDTGISNKIGRVAELKENIGSGDVGDVHEISDDDDTAEPACKLDNETTPTTVPQESPLHIKLQSASKSKRKINMSAKPPKPIDEEDPDDSVVYLEEIPKKSKKKSERKKKKSAGASVAETGRVTKVLELAESIDEEASGSDRADKSLSVDEPMETDELLQEVIEEEKEPSADDQITTIPPRDSTPEEPEAIHDEIIGVLSDSDGSDEKNSPGNETSFKDSLANKVDISKLTPKQLARRQELEARRLEKELARQKEREAREQQRLKEKEQREEAKRKEREEKEEARRREKEERDRKKQAS